MPVEVALTVNGRPVTLSVEPRRLLLDVLRDDLGLTGTHEGCDYGVCGACTILLDDEPARACLLFAVQASGHRITTVEGLGTEEQLHPLQAAFRAEHGLQCGFCTPGFVMTAYHFLQSHPRPTRAEIREALAGNLCRCTGYQFIVNAVERAARMGSGAHAAGGESR
jgi:carbon-monoxide dehydrogenase small subunit